MIDYSKYKIYVDELKHISKIPRVVQSKNLIIFKKIITGNIITRIVWTEILHLIIFFILYEKFQLLTIGAIYFTIGSLVTIYFSIISYPIHIIDLHKKMIYYLKFKKIKSKYNFSDIRDVNIKTTVYNYVTQHQKISLKRDCVYSIQIQFNDGKKFIIADLDNNSALKYRAIISQLVKS